MYMYRHPTSRTETPLYSGSQIQFREYVKILTKPGTRVWSISIYLSSNVTKVQNRTEQNVYYQTQARQPIAIQYTELV